MYFWDFVAVLGLLDILAGVLELARRGDVLESAITSPRPLVIAFRYFLLGLVAAGVSLWLLPVRLVPAAPVTGLSLFLAPFGAGFIAESLGQWRRATGAWAPNIATFHAGAAFAFAVALLRLALAQ
jgi:hypothetical protein